MKTTPNGRTDAPARILVVDDEIWICEFLKEVLTHNGYDVATVTDESAAFRLLDHEEFDLVLTDLVMDGSSGYGIIEKTRRLDCAPEVVVMTGYATSEHATRVLKFGAFDYLAKPVESERLHLTIQRALEHRRLKMEVARLSGEDRSVSARVYAGSVGFYDSVTGLANRSLMLDRLDQAIIRQSGRHKYVAVIVIGVDRYRQVCLAEGIARGDALLVEVAGRLREVLFERDTLARPSDDQFAIVAEVDSTDTVMTILSRVLRIPYATRTRGGTGGMGPEAALSCGVAIFPEDGKTAQELYNHALAALDAQQRRGGNGYQFYQAEQDRSVRKRIRLERRLAKAVESNRLSLSVQPYYRFANDEPNGGEALLRWNDPVEGEVSPSVFIPLLEKSRLIIPVTEWIVTELGKLQAELLRAGFENYHLSFNVSPVHLQRLDDASQLLALMVDRLPDINRVVVEVTEGVFLSDTDTTSRVFALFKEAGVRTAIDDFGTGYSSLSYLTTFYFEFLKVDRSFVSRMDANPKDETVVSAIVSMAQQLGMATIAEGVETATQVESLKRLGCDLAQGYLYSKPIPAERLVDFFHRCSEPAELLPVSGDGS